VESTFVKVDSVEFSFDCDFNETASVDESILDQAFFRFLFDVVREFDFRLEIGNRGDIREVGVTSKLGWEESFDPGLAHYAERGYFASIAASTKLYWSSNAGALTVEITASAPLNALTNDALSLKFASRI